VVEAPARFTAVHDRVLGSYELAVLQPRRAALIAKAKGTVVELGGGTGVHWTWYPPEVERVVVVGPDPFVRSGLERRARHAPVPVTFVDSLTDPALADASADTVVSQLVLCAVGDIDGTLGQVHRLLASSGRLLFFEHVPPRGDEGLVRTLARPFWRSVSAGCDLLCDAPAAIRRNKFLIVDLDRLRVPTVTLPLRSCAAGVARRANPDAR